MYYIEEKVKGIMSKLFGWIVFWTVVHFIRTGEVYELWGNLTAGAFSGGILPVSWFLYTYCLLMVLSYPMFYLQKRNEKAFAIASLVWIAVLALGFGDEVLETRTQSLWLHLYAGYFALGMTLNRSMEFTLGCIKRKHQLWCALLVNIMCLAVYLYHIKAARALIPPHNYYGKWYYTLWLVSLFWIIALIQVENIMLRRLVERLSANTLVVYLAPHLPILYIIGKMPLQDTKMGLLFIALFFLGSELLAEVFRKMPLLRQLV